MESKMTWRKKGSPTPTHSSPEPGGTAFARSSISQMLLRRDSKINFFFVLAASSENNIFDQNWKVKKCGKIDKILLH